MAAATTAVASAPAEYGEEEVVQEYEEEPVATTITTTNAVRFPAWVGLLIFSSISLISTLAHGHKMDNALKWTLVVTTLSTVLGVVSVFGYLFSRGIFMGQLPEAVLVRTVVKSIPYSPSIII
jgi:hypothetical protein